MLSENYARKPTRVASHVINFNATLITQNQMHICISKGKCSRIQPAWLVSSVFFLLLLQRSWLPSDMYLNSFPFMRSPSLFTLSYDTFVIHWRRRGDRKMDDRDISARNYCYWSRVQILACIRTEEGWGVGEREGKPLAQLLIWYSRLVRKGRWSGTPDPR